MADPSIGCVETPGGLVNPDSNIISIILSVAGSLMTFVAGIAIATLIYGGIRYAMAIGNEEAVNKAKRIIFWSVFGLIVAILARFVANFVLDLVG